MPIYIDNPSDRSLLINRAAFALPAPGTFGNLGRGAVRAPGIKNIDFSAAKNWRLGERSASSSAPRCSMSSTSSTSAAHNASVAGGGIENNLANGGFGRAGSSRGPREIQFGMKLTF